MGQIYFLHIAVGVIVLIPPNDLSSLAVLVKHPESHVRTEDLPLVKTLRIIRLSIEFVDDHFTSWTARMRDETK